MHGGLSRQYMVYIPPTYDGSSRWPLIFVIHGAMNTIALVRGWAKMEPQADAEKFIIVYPQGDMNCWNAGGCCCGATADDVGFIRTVLSDVSSHACIDSKRVFAAGISNGAMFAHRLGCEAADVFAAVAGVAGPVSVSCSPSRPITVVYFHGTADTTVGFSGAEGTFTGWGKRDGCTGTPVETYNQGSTICRTYQTCNAGVEVAFCAITGMGHCWPEDTACGPQQGAGVTDFKMNPMMWSYFNRHPLP
jgi:polyhydroxybutyrate depolymerase